MFMLIKSSWALMIGMLLIMLGNGMQSTLLGIRGSIEEFTTQSMGYIMSAYYIGFLGGSKMVTVMLRRVGHVRTYAALGSFASAAFILYPVFVDPIVWFLMRVVVGFCLAGLYVVSESWLNDIATNKTRGKLLSLYTIMQMAGIIVGQVMINLDDPAGYNLFVLMSVLVSLSFAPILLSINAAPEVIDSQPMSIMQLYKASPLGVVGVFLSGGVFSALFGMASVFAFLKGFSVGEIAVFVMVIYMGGVIMQYPIGWVSDKVDRRALICLLAVICAGVCGSAFVFDDVRLLWVAAFVIGGSANPMYTLLIAYTNDYLENNQMAAASGGLIFVSGVGSMGGPIIVGYMMDIIGAGGFFLYIAILMGMIAVYSLFRMTQRTTSDDSSPFVVMPISSRGSTVIGELTTEVIIDEIEKIAEEEDESSHGEDNEDNNKETDGDAGKQ